MPQRQSRLPGMKWSETSTKPPRSRPAAPEGQLFPTAGYEQAPVAPTPQAPGWGVAHGRPERPRPEPQVEQPQLTPFKAPGPQFAERGVGKYYNPRNTNGQQFNTPAIRQSAGHVLDSVMTARYYRYAGMIAGMRGALGLDPVPSHTNDWIRARHAAQTGTQGAGSGLRTRGLNPSGIEARHIHDYNYNPGVFTHQEEAEPEA